MGFFKNWKDKFSANKAFKAMAKTIFPDGEKQIRAETEQLFLLLDQKVSMDEARGILTHGKSRVFLGLSEALHRNPSADTEAILIESIKNRAGGMLTQEDAKMVYAFILSSMIPKKSTKTPIIGESAKTTENPVFFGQAIVDDILHRPDEVVKIDAKTTMQGITMEYAWIEKRYGEKGKNWDVLNRVHGNSDDGNAYEIFTIKTKKDGDKIIAFDISSFYGK